MSQENFSLVENNDVLVTFTLYTDEDKTSAVDLSNVSDVEFYLKDSAKDVDADGVKYAQSTGEVEVTDAANGVLTVQFDGDHIGPGVKSKTYHLDTITNGKRLTYAYGTITVTNV